MFSARASDVAAQNGGKELSNPVPIGVISAEAEFSTAELVIQLILLKRKMDSRFRGNDAFFEH
jgi:hypothetical protein